MVYQCHENEQYYYDSSYETAAKPSTLRNVLLISSIAAGVQYGWALQLSLLTPYIQLLGVSHEWSAFIWLCGPISGLLVQPTVGYYSDRCTSRFGRRRPFIVVGAVMISVAVVLIGFAADIGHGVFGDSLEHRRGRPAAVMVFVSGFWLLDIGNNTLQGPCRALLADISGDDEAMLRVANALFAFFMAIGNIIGYAAGGYSGIHRILPFSETEACDIYCANLKTCFLLSIMILSTITGLAVTAVTEKPLPPPSGLVLVEEEEEKVSCLNFFDQLILVLRSLSKPMWALLLLTSLNWTGWFPFLMYDTDWMGKEVYGGDVDGNDEQRGLYAKGIHAGSMGLMIYVVTLGATSLAIEPLVQFLGGVKNLWGLGNFLLAFGMGCTVLISNMAKDARRSAAAALVSNGGSPDGLVLPPFKVQFASMSLFALLGIPQAVTYSIPFALTSIISNSVGAGQGLSLGVLNLSIVIPQIMVAVAIGPLDESYHNSNLPGFVVGGFAAAIGGIFTFFLLPT